MLTKGASTAPLLQLPLGNVLHAYKSRYCVSTSHFLYLTPLISLSLSHSLSLSLPPPPSLPPSLPLSHLVPCFPTAVAMVAGSY